MNLLVAGIIAAEVKRRKDEERAAANRERREAKLREDEKARRRMENARKKIVERSYIDCIMKEMAEEISKEEETKQEGILMSFCEKFKKTYETISWEDAGPLIVEAGEIEEQIKELDKKVNEFREKLDNRVLQISNKLKLTIETLENDKSPSIYRERFNKLNLNQRDVTLQKEIRDLQRKIKYIPLGRERMSAELEVKQQELDEIYRVKTEAEEFESLSSQDKKDLLEYFLLSKEHSDLVREFHFKKSDIERVKNIEDDDRRYRTLGRMLNEGIISEEDFDKILRTLDKVGVKASRGSYDFKIWSTHTDGFVEHHKSLIKWFVKDVYDVNKRDIDKNASKPEDIEK